jgi:hypothetical protein
MAQEKPANQDLTQGISRPFLGSEFETMYEQYMDMMLTELGRNVVLYMPPGAAESSSNPSQYNPWLQQKDPRLGGTGEGNAGFTVSPIYVTYRAHVMHGPKKNTPDVPWDLNAEDVMLSMTVGALDDIKKAVEVEVDGIKYSRKSVDIRQIGLTTPKYIITFWSRKVAD